MLILGFGGGSVARVFRGEYAFQGFITGVEIDPVVIDLSRKHFPEAFRETELIQEDACLYLKQTGQEYDLIIIDLFIDNRPLARSYGQEFLKDLTGLLKEEGRIYHNLMLEKTELDKAIENYQKFFGSVEVLYLLGLNQLIVAENPIS